MRFSRPLAVFLDTGPLGLLTAPVGSPLADACKRWYELLETEGCRFYVPQIADYELRRELVRAGKPESLQRLGEFNGAEPERYITLSIDHAQKAAELWADARNDRRGGAPDAALDGDVLIAAQALMLRDDPSFRDDRFPESVIATTNKKHMIAYAQAETWNEILTAAP